MGVKFAKEYEEIIAEMAGAFHDAGQCHEWLDMSKAEWDGLGEAERRECIRTLADDIFYGLGSDPHIQFGECVITYDSRNHVIHFSGNDNVVRVIRLI